MELSNYKFTIATPCIYYMPKKRDEREMKKVNDIKEVVEDKQKSDDQVVKPDPQDEGRMEPVSATEESKKQAGEKTLNSKVIENVPNVEKQQQDIEEPTIQESNVDSLSVELNKSDEALSKPDDIITSNAESEVETKEVTTPHSTTNPEDDEVLFD